MTLLTVDEFRALEPNGLTDAALQLLLDAAEQEIVKRVGALDELTDYRDGGGRWLPLVPNPAVAEDIDIDIVETRGTTSVTLSENDWRLVNGYMLERLDTGDHPACHWADRVAVTYTPLDTTATRKVVQADLVRIELAGPTAAVSERIGEYATSGLSIEPRQSRASALARLRSPGEIAKSM